VPKAKQSTKIDPPAAAALRLLLFTGCRLREVLHLRWQHVDLERGCLFLPDSKTGRKTVILNAPALAVLNGLERVSPYVVPPRGMRISITTRYGAPRKQLPGVLLRRWMEITRQQYCRFTAWISPDFLLYP
jgi:integrase